MTALNPAVTVATLGGLLLAVALGLTRTSKKAPLPGPPGTFFFGNALQMPKQAPWLKFTEWGVQYGDIVFAKIFTRKLVIIHTYDLAIQLFEKRSANYANRPRRYMAELSGFAKAMLFKSYGEDVKKSRKMIHSGLGAIYAKSYQTMHADQVQAFAKLLLDNPREFRKHIRTALTSHLLRLTYAHKVESNDDILISLSEKVMRITGKVVSPNRYLVDTFPFLNSLPEWFPGTSFKQSAKKYKVLVEQLMTTPFQKVKEQMRNHTAEPSITSYLLEGALDTMSVEDEELVEWASGMITAAGVESTASVLLSFFLAMVRNQGVQEKAQHELDAVLGRDVLPTFGDRDRLPYLECLLKESMRWHPPTPLIARSLKDDDIVNGCEVKAGSFLVANVWSYTHDPSIYPEPFEFNPSRFLPKESDGSVPPDPRLFVFGFGRRRCPGIDVGNNILYMMIATTLVLFRILPELDENGQPQVPEVKYNTALTCHPVPFNCKIVPRSPEAAQLIQYAYEAQ